MIVNPASDPHFSESPLHGESAQRELFRSVYRYCNYRKDTCLDVGAHIGLFSIAAAERFVRVVAFEPWEENYDCLVENTSHLPIIASRHTIGCNPGIVLMEMGQGNNSGCRYNAGMALDRNERVGGVGAPLDMFDYHGVGLIKIDVEGAEGFVVEGARGTIARCKPVIVFEDNGLGPKHYSDWVDPKTVLAELGYRRATRLPGKNEVWVPK